MSVDDEILCICLRIPSDNGYVVSFYVVELDRERHLSMLNTDFTYFLGDWYNCLQTTLMTFQGESAPKHIIDQLACDGGLLGEVTTMRCLEIQRSKPLRRRHRGSARHAVCGTASTNHVALSSDPIALSTVSTDHVGASKDHTAASPARPHATGSSKP